MDANELTIIATYTLAAWLGWLSLTCILLWSIRCQTPHHHAANSPSDSERRA